MGDPVQEGHDEVDARPQHRAQAAEAFHDVLFGLRHDPHAQKDAKDDEKRNGQVDAGPADQEIAVQVKSSSSNPQRAAAARVAGNVTFGRP